MATKADKQRESDDKALGLFRAAWGPAYDKHEKRCKQYKAWHDAYKPCEDASKAKMTERLHDNEVVPWYVYQTIELLAANLIDELDGRVTPLNMDGSGQVTTTRDQQDLHRWELIQKILRRDRAADEFSEKNPRFVKQALIMGLSPAKLSWAYEEADEYDLVAQQNPETLAWESHVEVTENAVVCNRNTFTPLRVYDFLWDPRGRYLADCAYALHRSWQTPAALKEMAEKGVYRNVDQISDANAPKPTDDSGGKDYIDCPKGSVEVVEYWTRKRLITVANRTTVIRDQQNPHWHGELPFVVATTVPDLYSVGGISEVETILDVAKALVRSLNQRLDNADMVNSGMIEYDPENMDPKELEKLTMKPRAALPNKGFQAWRFINTNTGVLTSAIASDETLKNDLRDIPGASAFLSGASDSGVDQNTATGIQLIQNMAQKRLVSNQNQLAVAYRRKGRMEIRNIQQFTRQPDTIRIDKKIGYDWIPYTPNELRGAYDYEISDAQESIDKQTRRAAAAQELQIFMGLAAQMQMSPTEQYVPSLKEAGDRYLEAMDVEDPDRFWTQKPPMPPPMPLGASPLPGSGPAPGPSAPTPGIPPAGVNGQPSR